MQRAQKSVLRYTVPQWARKLYKNGALKCSRLPTPEDLIPLSKKEQRKQRLEELHQERKAKRDAQREWMSADDLKRLATQLGVARVISARSRSGSERQGEYVDGTLCLDWAVSDRFRAIINGITEMKSLPVILINVDVAGAHFSGVRGALAHEIGHHIDYLANGYSKEREPSQRLLTAFHREGFWISPDSYSELIAETLGQYLGGHKLNSMLLAEVNKVLAKLTRKHQRIIQAFRNRQSQEAKEKLAA